MDNQAAVFSALLQNWQNAQPNKQIAIIRLDTFSVFAESHIFFSQAASVSCRVFLQATSVRHIAQNNTLSAVAILHRLSSQA